jgi:ferredoxin
MNTHDKHIHEKLMNKQARVPHVCRSSLMHKACQSKVINSTLNLLEDET